MFKVLCLISSVLLSSCSVANQPAKEGRYIVTPAQIATPNPAGLYQTEGDALEMGQP